MKRNIILLFALGWACLPMMVACSDESDNPAKPDMATRQTTEEGTETAEEGDDTPTLPDETGAAPTVTFYSVDEGDTVSVTPGESQTAQAPLAMTLEANIGNPDGYNYICEWRVWSTNDGGSEYSPLVTRFEENTTYTLTKSGGYGIKLYVSFTQDGDTIEYESETMTVVISESKLTAPDGFSPNGDSINDYYRITAQSIVRLEADFFSRWGVKLHSATLDNAKHVEGEPNKLILWDGKYNGKVVDDGVYLLHLYGLGSDGIEYKIKKTISVLTGFRENEETGGGGS